MVETDRLLIFPLTGNQLQLLLSDLAEFEKQIAFYYDGERLEDEIYDIFSGQIASVQNSKEEYVWHTFWMMVLKEKDTIIGSLCYKNIPSSDGSVEIGYGINPQYESQGYTTEAVGAMIQWALKQSGVSQVIAEVDQENIASQKVLQKNGLHRYKSVDHFYWYSTTD